MRKPLPSVMRCLATGLLCVALAACKPPAQEAAAPTPDATAAPAAAAADAATATAAAAAGHSVDGDIIVSTNEPSWNASVSGPVLVLGGIDGQRNLAVSSNASAGGTRALVASDANGKVEVQVTAKECQDTMSGAMFPFSAVLVIDGGTPINGCARPASMPPPGKGM